jgi:exosortase H (IPTLxxWG-CTERM-specific)
VLRFFFIFLVLLLVCFVGELTPWAQHWLVLPWTAFLADVSAVLVKVFDPNVISYGKVIQDTVTGQGVSIESGCNGIEAFLVLMAALLAYPAPWGVRVAGVVAGFFAIQIVNLGRIITLFYLAAWNHQVFEFAHLYLWQALIMLDVVVVWLFWMRWATRQQFRQENSASAT